MCFKLDERKEKDVSGFQELVAVPSGGRTGSQTGNGDLV